MGADNNPGGQCLSVDGNSYGMYFDGWKCYFRISKPDHSDLAKYPIVDLTCPFPYEPQKRCSSRRLATSSNIDIDTWRMRLGFPPIATAENTIKNTTFFIKTLESETRDYMRDHKTTRVWALRPRRINDTCYSDTFFSSIVSVCKFKCFQ